MLSSVAITPLKHEEMTMATKRLQQAPPLDCDANYFRIAGGGQLTPDQHAERDIVYALIGELRKAGFPPVAVEHDERISTRSAIAMMEEAFGVDDCWLVFRRSGGTDRLVRIVMGNGVDIVSDWLFGNGDPDGFNAAMLRIVDTIGGAS